MSYTWKIDVMLKEPGGKWGKNYLKKKVKKKKKNVKVNKSEMKRITHLDKSSVLKSL